MPTIVRIDREEFISDFFDYKPGEHVTFLAPTGNGKTTLAMQLLGEVATPELPAVALVMKPRDETSEEFGEKNGYKKIENWPPRKNPFAKKPPGYLLWPHENWADLDETDERQAIVFEKCLKDTYRKGGHIIFADELYSLDKELGLDKELNRLWTKGRSMGTGIWGASQRPANIPRNAYSQAQHLFLSWDPDKDTRRRYGEIGGMDPHLVIDATEQTDEYEWVYVHPKGRQSTICIVSA